MFRIEFDGKVLPGFDPRIVHLEVALRLRLSDPQVERLFSGHTVILKKSVHEGNAPAYLNELRSMGLDARLVRLDDGLAANTPAASNKLVFWGRVLPGFERTAVMTVAVKRLKVSPSQLKQIFSGIKVVLKRGLTVEQGQKFALAFAQMGMQVELEPEEPVAVQPESTPAAAPEPAAQASGDDPVYRGLLSTACDLSGTPFAGYDTSSEFARDDDADTPPPAPVPPPAVPAVQTPQRYQREGFEAASQDGFLNCPHCGQYQAQAEKCRNCGDALPQRKLFVGKTGEFVDDTPTTLVTPAQARAKTLDEAERRALRPSLHTLMEIQEDEAQIQAEPGRRQRLLGLGLILLVLVVGGLLALRLMHRI